MALVSALEVEVTGDINLDVKINDKKVKLSFDKSAEGDVEMKANENEERNGAKEGMRKRDKIKRIRMVTAAATVECVYQYPERLQVEAMLSNMMNQLAKVYVRVREFVSGSPGVVGGVLRGIRGFRRAGETRFRVVSSTNVTYFDEIYANMTEEYRNLYNSITYVVPRTSNPCSSQSELKGIWRHLLDSSISFLKTAVARSVGHFLRTTHLSRKKRFLVLQMVESEMAKVKSSQLDTLCDGFQLCFNELL